MPERTLPIRKGICLNESEWNLIQHKMRLLGTHNFGAYALHHQSGLHRAEKAGCRRQPHCIEYLCNKTHLE